MNQLKAGAFLSYLSLLLANLTSIFYTPFMLRMLGQVEYGLYALVLSVVGYLTILDFGFGNTVVRYTAKYRAENNTEKQSSLFGMFISLYSGIGLLTVLLGCVLYLNVDLFFNKTMTPDELEKARVMMGLLIFNMAVSFPFSIFGSIITAYENFIFQRVVNIVRILAQPLIMIVLLYAGYKAIAMVVVVTVLNIVVLLINTWYCFARLHIHCRFGSFDWKLLKELAGYSYLVFMGIIIDKIYWSSGQFVMGAVSGAAAIAVYALAMQLQGYYMNFSNAISGVFLPKVTGMVSAKASDEELSFLFIRVGRILYSILSFILFGFIIFGHAFIRYWAGENYNETYYISLIVMIPLTIPLIQSIGLTILQAKARLKFRSYSYLVIALLSFALSIPLAHVYGGIGYAFGTSFCLLMGNGVAMNIYYSRKIGLNIKRFWFEIGKMSLPLIMVLAVTLGITSVYPVDSVHKLIGGVVLFSVVYIPVLWFFSLNNYERRLFGDPVMNLINKLKK